MTEPPRAGGRLRHTAKIFVRALTVEAEIGVHAHEQGRRQPLIVDVEVDVAGPVWRSINETLNYEVIVGHARQIAESGHIGLVETYAWRLAKACLAERPVTHVRVRVEKPLALAPGAEAAGVEIALSRE